MWADTVYAAEKRHLLLMLCWGGGSAILGSLLYVLAVVRWRASALLKQFGAQTAFWGLMTGVLAVLAWRALHLPDLSEAARFERLLWLRMGLEVGAAALGLGVALTAWRLARRLGVVGGGLAALVQALALLMLDLQLAAVVSR